MLCFTVFLPTEGKTGGDKEAICREYRYSLFHLLYLWKINLFSEPRTPSYSVDMAVQSTPIKNKLCYSYTPIISEQVYPSIAYTSSSSPSAVIGQVLDTQAQTGLVHSYVYTDSEYMESEVGDFMTKEYWQMHIGKHYLKVWGETKLIVC